jgi:8-oxo-dGTP pyrophosphatase MutT (NUDIX family)
MSSRSGLIQQLHNYTSSFREEEVFILSFLKLLQAERCYYRDYLPGHITGSAWILNPSRSKVLMVYHAKLNKWLQPGGHADGDENIVQVALREAREETGLNTFTVIQNGIFDIDIHPIPQRQSMPEHDHYDVRFLLEANDAEPLIRSEESHEVAWISIDDLYQITAGNASIVRMMNKTLGLP